MSWRGFAILIGLSVGWHPWAVAQMPCPEVRLDRQGYVLAQIPVFNQAGIKRSSDTQICYAVTAAQMHDALKGIEAQDLVTSPFWAALLYTQQQEEKGLSVIGGNSLSAVQLLFEKGVCSNSKLFPSMNPAEALLLMEQLSDFYYYEVKQEFRYVFPMKNGRPDIWASPQRIQSQLTSKEKAQVLQEILQKSLKISDIEESLFQRLLSSRSWSDFLATYFSSSCSIPRMPDDFHPMIRTFERDKKTGKEQVSFHREMIESLTQERPLPVQISYCAEILRDPNYPGVQFSKEFYLNCSRHSSLVIGSRLRGNKCEFLVRDSYGAQACEKRGNYSSKYSCEGGQVWIPVEKLLRAVNSGYWFQQ